MSILDNKHILTINLDDRSIRTKSNIRFYNTDRNIAILYIKLEKANSEEVTIDLNETDLTGLKLKLTVIKPKTNEFREITGVLTKELQEYTCAIYKFELPLEFTDQAGIVYSQFDLSDGLENGENITIDPFSYEVKQSKLTGLNAEIIPSPDLPVLKQLIEEMKKAQQWITNIDDTKSSEVKTYSSKKIEDKFTSVSEQFNTITNTTVPKIYEDIKAIPKGDKGDKGEPGTASVAINDTQLNTSTTWSGDFIKKWNCYPFHSEATMSLTNLVKLRKFIRSINIFDFDSSFKPCLYYVKKEVTTDGAYGSVIIGNGVNALGIGSFSNVKIQDNGIMEIFLPKTSSSTANIKMLLDWNVLGDSFSFGYSNYAQAGFDTSVFTAGAFGRQLDNVFSNNFDDRHPKIWADKIPTLYPYHETCKVYTVSQYGINYGEEMRNFLVDFYTTEVSALNYISLGVFNLKSDKSGSIEVRVSDSPNTLGTILFSITKNTDGMQVFERYDGDLLVTKVILDWSVWEKYFGTNVTIYTDANGYANRGISKRCVHPRISVGVENFNLNLPNTINLVENDEFELYRNPIIPRLDTNQYTIRIENSPFIFKADERKFKTTPSVADTNVKFKVLNNSLTVVAEKTVSIKSITPKNPSVRKNIMFLGDSLTDGGGLTANTLNKLTQLGITNYNNIGTRNGTGVNHEGRAGWHYTRYLSSDSPFWNPNTSNIDFKYYCTQNGFESIDVVMILLGWNAIEVTKCKEFITKLKADFPNVKICLCGLQVPHHQHLFETKMNCINYNEELNKIALADENISHLNISISFDSEYGLNHTNTQANKHTTDTVRTLADYVHPNSIGQLQIADGYARELVHILSSF